MSFKSHGYTDAACSGEEQGRAGEGHPLSCPSSPFLPLVPLPMPPELGGRGEAQGLCLPPTPTPCSLL